MATRKPATTPRKHASQQRSKATVAALVEATARILVHEGYDKASTNRVAEAAGVSVGSLYQYFPGKEALVAAVVDRHNGQLMELVRATFAQVAGLPLADGVPRIVAVAVAAHRIDPALHRVLAEQIPRTGRLAEVEAFNREAAQLFRDYLERRRAELGDIDAGLAAYICVSAIESVAHNAVLYHAGVLTAAAEGALVGETARMVTGYLTSAAA